MRKILFLIVLFFLSSCEKDTIPEVFVPISLEVSKGDYHHMIKLSWNLPPQANLDTTLNLSYEIYKSFVDSNNFHLLATTNNQYFEDTASLIPNQHVFYKIRSIDADARYSKYTPVNFGYIKEDYRDQYIGEFIFTVDRQKYEFNLLVSRDTTVYEGIIKKFSDTDTINDIGFFYIKGTTGRHYTQYQLEKTYQKITIQYLEDEYITFETSETGEFKSRGDFYFFGHSGEFLSQDTVSLWITQGTRYYVSKKITGIRKQ